MGESLDEQILKQQEAINQGSVLNTPFIGEKCDLAILLPEFENHQIFYEKTKSLMMAFPKFRRVRGDGNCFFRGFGFALLEFLRTTSDSLLEEVIEKSKNSHGIMERYYSSFVFEDYLEMFVEELKSIKSRDEKYVFDFFQDASNAESIVLLLRFFTSAEMRTNPDNYVHFLPPGFPDVTHYVSSEVETMGRESEEIHIVALASFLKVNLKVAHLDQSGTNNNEVNFHEYTYSTALSDPFFTILYRPGHYDLIYKI